MTEVLHSPSHFPTSSSSPSPSVSHFPTSSSSPSPSVSSSSSSNSLSCAPPYTSSHANREDDQNECDREADSVKERHRDQQLSLLALLVTLFRKSWVACKTADRREHCAMEIGWPSNVRHVAHVTFDRFNGFLGLPVEFEPEVPRRAPSASATVFGVSTESMQLSYDSRGNCVPMILLLMQSCLYGQGGLQAEGIFRITAGNSQEEFVRDQLNHGVVPEGIDVHCLAGLIKAWFRELPAGILDSLSPEEVMRCQSEEECAALVRLLPSTEAALLDWAINLMADVVQQEHVNKMNARNIAMVFAPNMTQMADPLTALMYAVQVMNFLKTLILRTLRQREDSVLEQTPPSRIEPFDENGHQSLSQSFVEDAKDEFEKIEQQFIAEAPAVEGSCNSSPDQVIADGEGCGSKTVVGKVCSGDQMCEAATQADSLINEQESGRVAGPKAKVQGSPGKSRAGQSRNSKLKKGPSKLNRHHLAAPSEKTLGISNLSSIDSRTERIEAWR